MLFLSREAYIDMGIISDKYLTVSHLTTGGESKELHRCAVLSNDDSSIIINCQCPKHTKHPALPTSLPYTATKDNRMKLKQLLNLYSSITFNTCEHQPLPMMEGPPMRLMIDPKVEPSAYHSPLLMPIH